MDCVVLVIGVCILLICITNKYLVNSSAVTVSPFIADRVKNERTNEVYLPMNKRVNNGRLPVEAEAHQSWPPKNITRLLLHHHSTDHKDLAR